MAGISFKPQDTSTDPVSDQFVDINKMENTTKIKPSRHFYPNKMYRHFKGNYYKTLGLAENSETGEMMVVYQAMYGDNKLYVRPYDMWMSEVDHQKYPDIKQKYRFELAN